MTQNLLVYQLNMTQADLEEEFGQPDPNCPHCKGTGFVDRDHGWPVDLDLAYANGAFVDAVECGCSKQEADPADL